MLDQYFDGNQTSVSAIQHHLPSLYPRSFNREAKHVCRIEFNSV